MRVSPLIAGASSLALVGVLAAAPAHARPHEPEVVADGLIGPLTLAVGGQHNVYVTQSFAGLLSSVDKDGEVTTVHELTLPPGTGELVGVAYAKQATYHIENDFSGETPASHIVKISKKGTRSVVSDDLWTYEIMNNPDGDRTYGFTGLTGSCAQELAAFEEEHADLGLPPLSEYQGIIESHAYQLTVSGGKIYVADAAANAVLAVDEGTGEISTVSVIPVSAIEFTAEVEGGFEEFLGGLDLPDCLVGSEYTPEPVPTDVQVGRHGTLYVSTLEGGAGELLPLSKVYRVDPRTAAATVVADGLHGATGLALAKSGHIFVAEMFGGQVSMVRPGRSTVTTVFAADAPADVDLKGSTIYATTGTFGNGALVKYLYPVGHE